MDILKLFFSKEIGSYWSVFFSYIDVFSFLKWMILGGLIGSLVVLFLAILLRKQILVKRKYKILKFVAYTYFFFLPLFAGFCASQWASLHNVEVQMKSSVSEVLKQTNEILDKSLRKLATPWVNNGSLDASANQKIDEGIELALGLIDKFSSKEDSTSSRAKDAVSAVSDFLKAGYLKDRTKDGVTSYLSESTGIDEALVRDLMDTELKTILDTGATTIFIEKKIESLFRGMKLQIILLFVIVMCFPIGEILIAHYLEYRRKEEETLQEVSIDDRMNDRD